MFRMAQIIITQESLETGIPMDMLTTKGRTRTVARSKRKIRKRLRAETDLSLREIDMLMGGSGRNHRIV